MFSLRFCSPRAGGNALDLVMIDIFTRGNFKDIIVNESYLCVRLIQLYELGSSVGIVTSLWAGRLEYRGSIPTRKGDSFLLHSV
jgi:hypothetical protein